MKTTDTIIHNNTQLTILVEEKEPNKAFATYFVNGFEVKEWATLKTIWQAIFIAMLDDICTINSLVKWSY